MELKTKDNIKNIVLRISTESPDIDKKVGKIQHFNHGDSMTNQWETHNVSRNASISHIRVG